VETAAIGHGNKAGNNSEFSMQLILFRDQSYHEISFL